MAQNSQKNIRMSAIFRQAMRNISLIVNCAAKRPQNLQILITQKSFAYPTFEDQIKIQDFLFVLEENSRSKISCCATIENDVIKLRVNPRLSALSALPFSSLPEFWRAAWAVDSKQNGAKITRKIFWRFSANFLNFGLEQTEITGFKVSYKALLAFKDWKRSKITLVCKELQRM